MDTTVLTLNQKMFTITDHDRFEPSTKGLYDGSYGLGGRGYITCKQNVTKTELMSGMYKYKKGMNNSALTNAKKAKNTARYAKVASGCLMLKGI